MYFAIITILPEMFTALTDYGITGRAVKNRQVIIECIDPRDFTHDNYRRIDDRPYGGGPGMVMMAEPLAKAITHAKEQAVKHNCRVESQYCPVVYLSPQGEVLSEKTVMQLHQLDGLILLCGRYEGVDERLITQYVDKEISIGDYVLTGGELPAMIVMDSIIRRLPDVMGDAKSAEQDSFVDGLLDCPHFTKPPVFEGLAVPQVLRSGHHANIAQWRFVQQVRRTQQRRSDLWQQFQPNTEQSKVLSEAELVSPSNQ